MLRRAITVAMIVGLLGASCSSNDEPDPGAPLVTDPPSTESTPGAGSVADGPVLAETFGVESIEVITPASGGGERPLLEWVAVEGAEEYDVVALTADGEPYWAWVGRTNSVVFGGGDPTGDAGQLAVVYGPLTWTVAAFDPDGVLLALSDRTPLAP